MLAIAFAAVAEPDPKVELGRRLFFDRTVSRMGRVSCSSCHLPEHGFSDPRVRSEDEIGDTLRHSPSILDVADGRPLHWDGEFATVRELLVARLEPFGRGLKLFREIRQRQFDAAKAAGRQPDEGDLRSALECGAFYPSTGPDRAAFKKPGFRPAAVPLVLRLREDERYEEAFRTAFGFPGITTDRVMQALEAYVLSLRSGENALDRHLAGDPGALNEAQRRGLAHFTGKAGCSACHLVDGTRPTLSDGGFHNTGVAFAPVEYPEDEEPTLRRILLEIARDGAGAINFVRDDLGKFRTPSLRDVARRGPYMHDGSLAMLQDVVRYYSRGGIPNPRLDERIRPLGLTNGDVSDLVAFLHALTSDGRPGVGPLPDRKELTRLRVVDLEGNPIRGLRVWIRPAGDRLEGGRADDPRRLVGTKADGTLAFRFPAWTHVHLTSDTHEIHYDWLIPDCAPPMDVTAAPFDSVALKLTVAGRCPDSLDAPWAGTRQPAASFRLVRRLARGSGIYVAERGPPGTRWVSATLMGPPRELDLSGGWTDPVDERGDPESGR